MATPKPPEMEAVYSPIKISLQGESKYSCSQANNSPGAASSFRTLVQKRNSIELSILDAVVVGTAVTLVFHHLLSSVLLLDGFKQCKDEDSRQGDGESHKRGSVIRQTSQVTWFLNAGHMAQLPHTGGSSK